MVEDDTQLCTCAAWEPSECCCGSWADVDCDVWYGEPDDWITAEEEEE